MTAAGHDRQVFNARDCCGNIAPNEAVSKAQCPDRGSEGTRHVESQHAVSRTNREAQLPRELIRLHRVREVLLQVSLEGLNRAGLKKRGAGANVGARVLKPVDLG